MAQGTRARTYEPAFRESEITSAVLPELTEADLKELGLPLGPRKLLLRAIASLPLSSASEPTPASTTTPREAERRQLTVLFCDLVGSTALSQRFDPEEMREVLRSYQNAVAGEVTRLEGHIAKFMGDGVLAYFGWPRAHEDEAERAVQAGLAVAEAVRRLSTPAGEPLAARVGIAKDRLDVHLRPSDEAFALSRDDCGLQALVERLAALPAALVVLEATGGCGSAWKKDPAEGVIGVQSGAHRQRVPECSRESREPGSGCWSWRRSRRYVAGTSCKARPSRRSAES